tara:strand:- start:329 stop:2536 length:2208 start_codon:yes stop_codon:yes gene_type:complete
MATLTGQQIDLSYQGLLKTNDNAALTGTAKGIQDGVGGATNIEMSNTATNFVSGTVDFTGSTVTGIPVGESFSPVNLSGLSQTLDLSLYNFGNGGTLSGNTTVAFSNIPTEKTFAYSYIVAADPFQFDGISYNLVNHQFGSSSGVDASFKPDGTIAFIQRGNTSGDSLKSFNLSTAWDITTAGTEIVSFDLQTQDNVMTGHNWKADGLTFWAVGSQNNSVYEYTLTTAWDLSTASYSGNSFSVGTQDGSPSGIQVKPDGTSFFIMGDGSNRAWQYNMSTAYDITTAVVDGSASMVAQDTSPYGILIADDGLSFTMSGNANDKLFSYNLTTAWDISTATYSGKEFDLSVIGSGTWQGICAGEDGKTLLIAKQDNSTLYQLDFGNAAVTLPSSVKNPITTAFAAGDVVTLSFYTLDGGTNIYVEEIPASASGGGAAAGLVNGNGTSSLMADASLLTDPAAANGEGSIALGSGATAGSTNNVSIGTNNLTDGTDIINIGDNNNMSSFSNGSVLIRPGGGTGIAFRNNSVTIGIDTYPGAAGIAIGKGATGLQNNPNICIGQNAEANNNAVAIGDGASARGSGTVVIGAGSVADNAGADGQIAIGDASDCSANRGIVIGVNGCTIASEGIAIGDNVDLATSDRAVALGNAITISGSADSITIGTQTNVSADSAIAIGRDASATAARAVAIGRDVVAAKASTVAVTELETKLAGGGITMVSPNGTEYKLTVSDAGALVIT